MGTKCLYFKIRDQNYNFFFKKKIKITFKLEENREVITMIGISGRGRANKCGGRGEDL